MLAFTGDDSKHDEAMDMDIDVVPNKEDHNNKEMNPEEVQGEEECHELMMKLHDCKQDVYKLKCDVMQELKMKKNMIIENLRKDLEEIKLENKTLKFIVNTIENPKMVTEIVEENNNLNAKVKELQEHMRIKDNTIKSLIYSPPLEQVWKKVQPMKIIENMDKPENEKVQGQSEGPLSNREKPASPSSDQNEGEEDSDLDLAILYQHKQAGSNRVNPQAQPEVKAQPKIKEVYKCDKCDVDFMRSENLNNHMDCHYEDGDYSCNNCSYQTNKVKNLRNHIDKTKHTFLQIQACMFCSGVFESRKELMTHRRTDHPSYKPCRNFNKNGNCDFGQECIYSHQTLNEGMLVCFQCGQFFSNKTILMRHRKSNHQSEQSCTKYANGQCT